MTRTIVIPFHSRFQKTDLLEIKEDGDTFTTYVWGVWDPILFPDNVEDYVYTVKQVDIGRIDILAYSFYGNPNLWWVIASHNLIMDPMTDMYIGQKLKIPYRDTVTFRLSNNDPVPSQTLGGT